MHIMLTSNIKDIEVKIPDITNLLIILTNLPTNTTLNAKIDEIKNKIPNITA